MGCGSSGTGSYARAQEQQRQADIAAGMQGIDSTFAKFTPEFYNQRADAYKSYAMPVLGSEAKAMQDRLAFSLADKGLLQSSAANQAVEGLDKNIARQQRGIVDTAASEAQNLRREVEDQRSALVSQLNASADPSQASQQALRAAATITMPSAFQPVGGFLEDWARIHLANQLGQQQQQNGRTYGFGNYLTQSPVTVRG